MLVQVGAPEQCKLYHRMCQTHFALADLLKAQEKEDAVQATLETAGNCMTAITRLDQCHSYVAAVIERTKGSLDASQ
jgi:hypothetical protein